MRLSEYKMLPAIGCKFRNFKKMLFYLTCAIMQIFDIAKSPFAGLGGICYQRENNTLYDQHESRSLLLKNDGSIKTIKKPGERL